MTLQPTSPSELWRNLAAAALLGTERQSPPITGATGTALDATLSALDPGDREGQLLGAAAATALFLRAGRLPWPDSAPTVEVCPPDELAPCGPGAAVRLAAMLGGQHDDLLPEWLAAVGAAGRRAPPRSLPELLELGRKDAGLRDLVAPVLGQRGLWLARQNPEWGWAVAGEDESLWQTGGRADRRELLRRRRASDPERARALLESTWADEPSDDRAAFLPLLAVGLVPADEPFLEAALADRRKEVRVQAADLLARLPGSRLVARTRERLQPCLELAGGGGGLRRLLGRGGARIEVSPPSALDQAAQRDGVEPKPPPRERIGEKAWWVEQMLGVVPPSTWSTAWGRPPAELVAAAKEGEWSSALLRGWTAAAERHRDAAWAEALLSASPSPDVSTDRLVPLLTPAAREAHARRLIATGGPLRGDHPALAFLQQCTHQWSPELTRAVLDGVRTLVGSKSYRPNADWMLRSLLPTFGRYMPPALADEAAAGWPTEAPGWAAVGPAVEQLHTLLTLRREMLEEIAR